MKVLQVIASVSRVHGGPSRAIVDMERALSARGIEVTTVTTNDDGDRSTLPIECGTAVALPDATRWYFPRKTVFYKVSIGLGRWLWENIGTFDIVHVHALFSFPPVVAMFLARRAGVPYVVRPLGVLAQYGMLRRRPGLKRFSFALLERPLLESASALHFTSRAEQLEAEALGLKCNSVVIPLGIDTYRLAEIGARTFESGAQFNLLFLSRIDPKKNVEGLLHALSLVRSKHPRVRMTIAGDGEPTYVNTLKALGTQLGLRDNLDWVGYVGDEQKYRVLEGADAFVLPSYSENFGIAAVEALATGLPCIVSDGVAISREIATAHAGVVTGTDVTSIVAGIQQILENRSEYLAMSAAARGLAASAFSIETMGARLEALYRRICASERGRTSTPHDVGHLSVK